MMAQRFDLHGEFVDLLIDKVSEDRYPSTTMLNLIEELMGPEHQERYARVLLSRVADDTFPSIPMLGRLKRLAS